MQRPGPFQPWDDLRDDNQMRQRGIGAYLPSLTAHLNNFAPGDRRCRVQNGDRCPL